PPHCFRRLRSGLTFSFVALTLVGVGSLALGGADAPGERAKSQARPPSFPDEIQPLLQAKCVRCHGEKALKGDLDLRAEAGIRKGGETGPVLVAGKPDESLLFEKVQTGKMPPGKKDRLGEAEVELLRRWIAGGARFRAEDGGKEAATGAVVTQHEVLPILLRRCSTCHGLRRQEGGLDLHTVAALRRGGKSGPAILPGQPEESPM